MCSLIECVLLWNVFSYRMCTSLLVSEAILRHNEMCSLIECVLLWNVFSYRMCTSLLVSEAILRHNGVAHQLV